MTYMLERQGAAYLPKRLALPHLRAGRLFEMQGAPTFQRNIFLIVNPSAASEWTWVPDLIAKLGA